MTGAEIRAGLLGAALTIGLVAPTGVQIARGASSGPEGVPAAAAPTPVGTPVDPLTALQGAITAELGKPGLAGTSVGLHVVRMTDHAVIFDHRGSEMLNPASNLKLYVAATALETLTPAYQFKTTFWIDGPIEDGVLRGNLYVKGGGNPVWPYEDVWKAVLDLKAQGLRRVEGDVIADESFFDGDRRIAAWTADEDDDSRAFTAQLGALSVNFNTVALLVKPGPTPGAPAEVSFETPTRYVEVENQVTTSARNGDTLSVVAVDKGPPVKMKATGTIGQKMPPRRLYRSVPDPGMYALMLISEMMEKEGIARTGILRQGKVPPSGKVLHTVWSDPLSILVTYMNKISSNFIAEQLLKTLGAERSGGPGSTAGGLAAQQRWLTEVGLWREELVIRNASGLSTENRVAASDLTRLLTWIHQSSRYRWEYISSLPIAAVDGTLRSRMKGTDSVGVVRAKTGSINGVYAMSGYVLPLQGDGLAFSFLVNELPRSRQEEARRSMERVLEMLVDWSRGAGVEWAEGGQQGAE